MSYPVQGQVMFNLSKRLKNMETHITLELISVFLGPVVQSIISLTSSLRGQLIKHFTTLYLNILIFSAAKAFLIFSTKNIGIFQILTFEILTKC